MKKLISFFASAFLLATMSMPASALTFQSEDNLNITENLADDAYLSGANVVIDADVAGDLYLFGAQVVINGNVLEDLVIGGGTVKINGDVAGDIRVAGGQVSINGNVGDDVVIAGGQVDINSGAVIDGTVWAGAGILTVDGYIGEELRGGMGGLIFNGEVAGDVSVTLEDTMSISDSAKIGGDFNYSALLEGTVPEGVVAGNITFNKFENNIVKDLTYFFFIEKLVSFAGAALLLILLVAFTPNMLKRSALKTRENVFKSFVLGLFVMIGGFLSFIILMVTWVGIPLAMLVLISLIAVSYLAKLFAVAFLGSYLVNYKKKISRVKLFFLLLVTLLAYVLVSLIPFAGWLVNLVLFLIGVGSIVSNEVELFKFLGKKKMI